MPLVGTTEHEVQCTAYHVPVRSVSHGSELHYKCAACEAKLKLLSELRHIAIKWRLVFGVLIVALGCYAAISTLASKNQKYSEMVLYIGLGMILFGLFVVVVSRWSLGADAKKSREYPLADGSEERRPTRGAPPLP